MVNDIKEKKVTTIEDLRQILIEEINNLREGKTTPSVINAITNATGKIFSSAKLQMEYSKMVGEKPDVGLLGTRSVEGANNDED